MEIYYLRALRPEFCHNMVTEVIKRLNDNNDHGELGMRRGRNVTAGFRQPGLAADPVGALIPGSGALCVAALFCGALYITVISPSPASAYALSAVDVSPREFPLTQSSDADGAADEETLATETAAAGASVVPSATAFAGADHGSDGLLASNLSPVGLPVLSAAPTRPLTAAAVPTATMAWRLGASVTSISTDAMSPRPRFAAIVGSTLADPVFGLVMATGFLAVFVAMLARNRHRRRIGWALLPSRKPQAPSRIQRLFPPG
jgi:hypothetical protein